MEALPTLFVLDPADETVALRWVGAPTVPQLHKLLDDAHQVVTATAHASGPNTGGAARAADEAFARAERLYGQGDNAGAVEAYGQALARAPEDWPPYGRAVESLLFALDRVGDCARAAALAGDAFPRLRRSSSAANVAASGLDCALRLPTDRPQRAALVGTLESDAREVVSDPALPVAADDRSGVYAVLVDARKAAKDEAGARKVAEEWAAFLEAEAARAESPERRAVFDSHRLSAYLELGQPERAIPMLLVSERDLPGDYNPPARLAVAYKELKRWDEALAASERALGRAYGPRRLRILQTRAEAFLGKGDEAAALRTLEEALATAEALPAGQRPEPAIASLKKRIESLRPSAEAAPKP